jgi:hypothetical protein
MTDPNIQRSTDFCNAVFTITSNTLTEHDWQGQRSYPVPALIACVASQFNADLAFSQRMKDLDLLVRFFIHDHPDYFIGVGSKGGVQRVADRDAKIAADLAKANAKKELSKKLDEKLASKDETSTDETTKDEQ